MQRVQFRFCCFVNTQAGSYPNVWEIWDYRARRFAAISVGTSVLKVWHENSRGNYLHPLSCNDTAAYTETVLRELESNTIRFVF